MTLSKTTALFGVGTGIHILTMTTKRPGEM